MDAAIAVKDLEWELSLAFLPCYVVSMEAGGKSGDAGSSRTIEVEMFCLQVPSEEVLFPTGGEATRQSPEFIGFQHFHRSRMLDHASVNRFSAPPEKGGQLMQERIALPAWKPRYRTLAQIKTQLAFDPDAPAEYYRAVGRLGDDLRLEWRIVIRPTKGYVFCAAYLILEPQNNQRGYVTCYSLRYDQIEEGESVQATVERLLRIEAEDFSSKDFGPDRPTMHLSNPFLQSMRVEIGEGAFVYEQDLRMWSTETKQTAGVANLTPAQRQLAADLMRLTSDELKPPKGARPRLPQGVVREMYGELVPVCTRLLATLAPKPWPPFRQRLTAVAHVEKHCRGSRDLMDALSDTVMSAWRCPSAEDVAVHCLARVSGLTETRIRQVIRK